MTATPPATDRSPLLLYKVHVDPAVNKGLQQYLRDRFCQLNGEYRTLMFPCDDPAARAMAEASENTKEVKTQNA